jgi:hypothetical protein
VSYILKKPTQARAANGTDDAGVDTGPPGLPVCVRNDDDPPEVAASTLDGPRRARADAVRDAFVAMFGRLEGLLSNRWTGAHDRLQALFPKTAAELEVVEKCVDDLAVRYIDGRSAEAAFASALAEYEAVYTRAAQLLAAQDRIEEGRCLECGRAELTVVVRDEQGHPYCRACRSPG